MQDVVRAGGFVLSAQPQGESDKRLVLLTREFGRITVFARGARRPGSPYLALSNPFVYATFLLREGRNAYTLYGAESVDYFDGIATSDPGVYYGFYFLDLAFFYGQENLEASESVNLLYTALRALRKGAIPPSFLRSVYECRLMCINGDFAAPSEGISETVAEAFSYVISAPYTHLFAFRLPEEEEAVFTSVVRRRLRRITGGKLKSESVLSAIDGDA